MNPDSLEFYWNNMLLLEGELSEVFQVVEPVDSNLKTYGPVLLKLILELGAELDSSFKSLVRINGLDKELCIKKRPNMGDYRHFSQKKLSNSLLSALVEFKCSGLTVDPWKEWRARSEKPVSIPAWNAYTGLKHNREANYKKATLGNAITLLAAVFSVNACTAAFLGITEENLTLRYPRQMSFVQDSLGSPVFMFTDQGGRLHAYSEIMFCPACPDSLLSD